MTDQLFNELTLAMSGNFFLAIVAAFGWGVLSILLSPCHLSSIPLIIGYISNQGQIKPKHSVNLALIFALGILITIAIVGLITASMGRLIGDVGIWVNWLIAVIFILIGLFLMDIIHWDWSGLNVSSNQRGGIWGALILGLVFGIGLGPCTFAFLAPVLGLVFQTATENWFKSLLLILAFGMGHITIIVIAGSLTNLVQRYLNWTEESKVTLYIKRVAGFFVILGGVYFLFSTY